MDNCLMQTPKPKALDSPSLRSDVSDPALGPRYGYFRHLMISESVFQIFLECRLLGSAL